MTRTLGDRGYTMHLTHDGIRRRYTAYWRHEVIAYDVPHEEAIAAIRKHAANPPPPEPYKPKPPSCPS